MLENDYRWRSKSLSTWFNNMDRFWNFMPLHCLWKSNATYLQGGKRIEENENVIWIEINRIQDDIRGYEGEKLSSSLIAQYRSFGLSSTLTWFSYAIPIACSTIEQRYIYMLHQGCYLISDREERREESTWSFLID